MFLVLFHSYKLRKCMLSTHLCMAFAIFQHNNTVCRKALCSHKGSICILRDILLCTCRLRRHKWKNLKGWFTLILWNIYINDKEFNGLLDYVLATAYSLQKNLPPLLHDHSVIVSVRMNWKIIIISYQLEFLFLWLLTKTSLSSFALLYTVCQLMWGHTRSWGGALCIAEKKYIWKRICTLFSTCKQMQHVYQNNNAG